MESNTEPQDSESKPKIGANKPVHKHWATWLLAALVLLLLAAGAYLWMQLQTSKSAESQLKKDKQQLQQQLDQLKSAAKPAGQAVACTYAPSADFKDNIKAALDSQNTAAFSTYTTNPVKYVLAASELGGDTTPDQAAINLDYTHTATGPWDFSLPAATTAGYDAGFYTAYFNSHTLVGKAASGMVVSFDFNCDGSKINQIFVAADASLL